jgi:hypothetical protein
LFVVPGSGREGRNRNHPETRTAATMQAAITGRERGGELGWITGGDRFRAWFDGTMRE